MKKFIAIIILLCIFIFFSYRYLKESIDEKKTYLFKISSKPLLYCKKKVELDDIDSFEFNEFFTILSNNDYQYKYSFSDDLITISLNNDKYTYPYSIKEKQKEIITEYVIKEVYVNTPSSVSSSNSTDTISQHSSEWMDQSDEYEAAYLYLQNSILSFEKGTDLGEIISAIQDSIDTNIRISVDYSSLNPNDEGEYPILIYSDVKNEQMIIKII